MKIMKKIVLITVLATQANMLNAASRACGCQRPQPQPAPVQPLAVQVQIAPVIPEQTSIIQDQSVNEVKMSPLFKECCMMIMDEAQRLTNTSLANEIMEMVHMAEMQEMQKCPCNKPKPPVVPQVQPQAVPAAPAATAVDATPEVSADAEKVMDQIPTRVLLAECCLALLDVAIQNGDMATQSRIEMIMKKVEMMASMPE